MWGGGWANKLHHLTSILSSLDARGNDLSKAFKIKVLAFILSYEKNKVSYSTHYRGIFKNDSTQIGDKSGVFVWWRFLVVI